MARRPAKKRKVVISFVRDAPAAQGGSVQDAPANEDSRIRARRQPVLNRVAMKERAKLAEAEEPLPSDKEILDNLPFCCAVCKCSQETKAKMLENDNFIQPAQKHLWHRRCCHAAFDVNAEWACPFTAASESAIDLLGTEPIDDALDWVTVQEISKVYKTAESQESAVYNADGEAHPSAILETSDEYRTGVGKRFSALAAQRKDDPSKLRGAVVVDAFAGIGTGIVVLKRLGIKMQKVVHIEHDKVATHVYRYNHDHSYNPKLRDEGIEHVYFQSFEEFEKNVAAFLDEHGPIDIILGGPPCIDYSPVNARRQGTQGESGSYMVRFGQTIRAIEQLQLRLELPHPLFFLAENVVLRKDLMTVRDDGFGFDFDPVILDALYVSPVRRNRNFFTNIPAALDGFDFSGPASQSSPTCCLEDGFRLAVHWITPNMLAKAQCLMASASRIDEKDSLRMYVFKQPDAVTGNYHGRPLNVSERERLMGYPEGYVWEAVKTLFDDLKEHGLARLETDCEQWRKSLEPKYHTFAGNYHDLPVENSHRFEIHPFPDFRLKMAPRVASATSTPTFFTAEGYSKHLIGLAYSVPVAELLLRPLTQIFGCKVYVNYGYRYKWEGA